MKRFSIVYFFLTLTTLTTYAGQFELILNQIEDNNIELKALRKQSEAEKEGNKIGLAPTNPEVEFAYLWGSTKELGNRMDIGVKQSLELSKVFGLDTRAARAKNVAVDARLRVDRMQILVKAEQLCIDITFRNALLREYRYRLAQAEQLMEAYRTKYDAGAVNAIEYNKVRMNYATAQGDYMNCLMERDALLLQLSSLNGGKSVEVTDSVLECPLMQDFNAWYAAASAKHPVLAYVNEQVNIAKAETRQSKGAWLPAINVGFNSEGLTGSYYRGLTVGMTVPLWEGAHRVGRAKAARTAAELNSENSKEQFISAIREQYLRAERLEKTYRSYEEALQIINTADLLMETLNAGKIDMLTYMMEIIIYYDNTLRALNAKRDYMQAYALLNAYNL